MVKSASEAADAYRRGIERIGVSNYQEAARTSTPQAAAEILEGAKADSLNVNDFVDEYRESYN